MISISERLRPFSHLPGTRCLIPGTGFVVEGYPALIRIRELSGEILREYPQAIQGPLQHFTLFQDLERGCVTVVSSAYHFHILPDLTLSAQKNPPLPPLSFQERLSLGSHKKQDWEMVKRRMDFHEIFPLWFRLGGLLSLPPREKEDLGIFSLVREIEKRIAAHRPEHLLPAFQKLFLAGFSGLLIPRLFDEEHQGILQEEAPRGSVSPLYLLSEGSALIRSLFFTWQDNTLSLLPNLPPDFFAGRMLNLSSPVGPLNLEWTKKTLLKVQFKAPLDGQIQLHLPAGLRTFRLRHHREQRGRVCSWSDLLELKSGTLYLLDQFKK